MGLSTGTEPNHVSLACGSPQYCLTASSAESAPDTKVGPAPPPGPKPEPPISGPTTPPCWSAVATYPAAAAVATVAAAVIGLATIVARTHLAALPTAVTPLEILVDLFINEPPIPRVMLAQERIFSFTTSLITSIVNFRVAGFANAAVMRDASAGFAATHPNVLDAT